MITKAKDEFKELQLDVANEMEEDIMINKIPESRINLKPPSNNTETTIGNSFEGNSFGSDNQGKPNKDWTSNKLKAHKLQDMLKKNLKMMQSIFGVYNQEFDTVTACEGKINKILASQTSQYVRSNLFRRLVRGYFAKRLCLQDLIYKFNQLLQLTAGLNWEIDWLMRTVYCDEQNEKRMGNTVKKSILRYLQLLQSTEISCKAIIVESICSYMFKEFEAQHLLLFDTYKDAQVSTLDDIIELQKQIRKGALHNFVQDNPEDHLGNSKRELSGSPHKAQLDRTPKKSTSPIDSGIDSARRSPEQLLFYLQT